MLLNQTIKNQNPMLLFSNILKFYHDFFCGVMKGCSKLLTTQILDYNILFQTLTNGLTHDASVSIKL